MDLETVGAVTQVAAMLTAVVAAGGSLWVVIRLARRVPRFVDQWLDRRAEAHAKAEREARALECLIAMQPDLTSALLQLGPNGGDSLYDVVHQLDAGQSEIRAWIEAHARDHGFESPRLGIEEG